MTKTMSAIALAMLLGAMPAAYAQTSHPTNGNPNAAAANKNAAMNRDANANPAEETIKPDQIRGSKMIGSTVYDVQNRNIGKVRELVLDKHGKVASVGDDVGTFLSSGGKRDGAKPSYQQPDTNPTALDRT